MALGKITIVIGAGIIGSILSKEGRLSDATSFFSSALRIVTKHLHHDKDVSEPATKPRNDTLLAQVNSLRRELQLLASSRSVTIVTSTRRGSRAYGVTTVLVVGCLGYGYMWWKGWKFTDMMFVTRHSFSNVCSAVGKQLELVSSSITSAKRHLSSKIDVVDSSLDETKELNLATKNEVVQLHGDVSLIHIDVESVTRAVRNLESKIDQIDDGQNFAGRGLYALCKFAEGWQQSRNKEFLQSMACQDSPASSSSSRAIKPPQNLEISRISSLPPLSPDLPLPSYSTGSTKVLRPATTISPAGLKELQEVSNPIRQGSSTTNSIKTLNAVHSALESSTSTPTSGRFTWRIPGINVLTRSRSTAN